MICENVFAAQPIILKKKQVLELEFGWLLCNLAVDAQNESIPQERASPHRQHINTLSQL